MGEHHGSGEIAFGCLPPVLEEASFDRERVVVEVESPALDRVGEVGLWIAGPQVGERGPLGGVVLAAVLGQAERAEPIAEPGVESARADGGELTGVTDEDRLPACLVDHAKQRREGARVTHAGLVDDQDAMTGEATVSGGVEKKAVEGGASDAGDTGELVGGAATRRRPDHRDPSRLVRLVEHAEGGGLSRTGDAGDADDPVGSQGGLADERALLAGQVGSRERLTENRLVHARRIRAAAGESKLERRALELEQLARREPRRPPRALLGAEKLDAGQADELRGRIEHLLGRATIPQRAGHRADELGHREGRLLLGKRVQGGQIELLAIDSRSTLTMQFDQVAQLMPTEAVLGRARLPLFAQPRQVDLFFRLTGGERGDAGSDEAFGTARLHVLDERLPPRRERPHYLLRYGFEVGHSLHRLGPAEAESPGDLVAQLRLVEVAGGEPVGPQDRLAVERQPLPVRRTSHVGDDHVGVQVRILRPAGAMSEGRGDEALCRAPEPRRRGRGGRRTPRARGRRAPPARPSHVPRSARGERAPRRSAHAAR